MVEGGYGDLDLGPLEVHGEHLSQGHDVPPVVVAHIAHQLVRVYFASGGGGGEGSGGSFGEEVHGEYQAGQGAFQGRGAVPHLHLDADAEFAEASLEAVEADLTAGVAVVGYGRKHVWAHRHQGHIAVRLFRGFHGGGDEALERGRGDVIRMTLM